MEYDNPNYISHHDDEKVKYNNNNDFNKKTQSQQIVNLSDNASYNITPAKYAVKVTNVSFNYGKNRMIENFNMQVENSSIYCLIGNSGAGK